MRAAVANRDRDVLLAVHSEADRRGSRYIVQAGAPKLRSGAVIARAEPAVDRSAEDQAARRSQNARGLRSALAGDPGGLARFEIGGLHTAVIAVAIQTRTQARADARGQEASLAFPHRRQVHAGFDQRRIQNFGFGVIGGRNPASCTACMGTYDLGFAVARDQRWIESFRSGL